MSKLNVVIVAGGLSSRLAPLTNYIPKFLINTGKETGFVQQVRYWMQYEPKTISVIVNEQYKELVSEYFKLYFGEKQKFTFSIRTVTEAAGSAHAIMSTCQDLVGQSVVFNWCDVLVKDKIDFTARKPVKIFINYEYDNRYDLRYKNNVLLPVKVADTDFEGGGIFGLYYIDQFKILSLTQQGLDFVDVIHEYGELAEYYIKELEDWGDMCKLALTRSAVHSSRAFNSIEVNGNFVIKTALNEQGKRLISKEIAWYQNLDELKISVARPEVWSKHDTSSFIMSKVSGKPIWNVWNEVNDKARTAILLSALSTLRELHSIPTSMSALEKLTLLYPDYKHDIKKEAFVKLCGRYEEIKSVLDTFGPINNVNGVQLQELDVIQLYTKLYTALEAEYSSDVKYVPIHGDSQFSNLLVDPATYKVTMIDPRGYFGETEKYGLADYDLAKVLYSLSGYDLFNFSQDFHISSIENGAIRFDMPKPNLGGCSDLIKETFSRRHYLWLAVIWAGLPQYISCDPVKMLGSHYYSMALIEKVLNSSNSSELLFL